MIFTKIRMVAASSALAAMLGGPATADACCLFNWFHKPACTTCASPVQQQVSYVPQTSYRTEYVNVPVTTMRPSTATDPCSGCPVTTMRPVTSYVTQARVVPTTTYRPVVTNVAAPTVRYAPAAPVAAPTYYQPTTQYVPSTTLQPTTVTQPAPACCGGQATSPGTMQPSIMQAPLNPIPDTSPSPSIGPQTTTPSLSPSATYQTPGYSPAPTAQPSSPSTQQPAPGFQQSPPSTFAPETNLRPTPDLRFEGPTSNSTGSGAQSSSSNAPRLLNSEDRTTARPMPQRWAVLPATAVKPSNAPVQHETARPTTDADGWHAAER